MISDFHEGVAHYKYGHHIGLFIRSTRKLIPLPNVKEVADFSEGLAAAASTSEIFYALERGTHKVIKRKITTEDNKLMSDDRAYLKDIYHEKKPGSVPWAK